MEKLNELETLAEAVVKNTRCRSYPIEQFLDAATAENILAIAEAFRAMEKRAEAAEANANQLRADGVEAFAHQQRVIADSLSGDMQRSHRITACRAEDYANQIRAGKDGE